MQRATNQSLALDSKENRATDQVREEQIPRAKDAAHKLSEITLNSRRLP
jgi:hypothetical protein